jgi:hypothetical protein
VTLLRFADRRPLTARGPGLSAVPLGVATLKAETGKGLRPQVQQAEFQDSVVPSAFPPTSAISIAIVIILRSAFRAWLPL